MLTSRNPCALTTLLRKKFFSQLDGNSLTAYVIHQRENTKWIPLMITNFVVHLYYMGVTMGTGELSPFIKSHNCIIGLDKDWYGKPYRDNLCRVRCLPFHLNRKEIEDGYGGLEVRTKKNSASNRNKVAWTCCVCQSLKTHSTFPLIFTPSVKMELWYPVISVRKYTKTRWSSNSGIAISVMWSTFPLIWRNITVTAANVTSITWAIGNISGVLMLPSMNSLVGSTKELPWSLIGWKSWTSSWMWTNNSTHGLLCISSKPSFLLSKKKI